ncbi:MAG: DUF444 family protein [Acidobacteriaceae bacterium]
MLLQDWLPLQDRSAERDEDRHQQRIKEAVSDHLRMLVVEESLVGAPSVRGGIAAIRSLRLARFRYASDAAGILPCDGAGSGDGVGSGVPDAELEMVHDAVARELTRRWRLPLSLTARPGTVEEAGERDVLRPRGQWAALDRRRSLRNAYARSAAAHLVPGLRPEDLRFRSSDDRPCPTAECLVIAVRDASGSMGDEKKFLCRSFFHWLSAFIRSQYQNVSIRFICHHTEAQAVEEEEFFRRVESGGTKVSSAYRLALQMAVQADQQGSQVIVLHFTEDECSLG